MRRWRVAWELQPIPAAFQLGMIVFLGLITPLAATVPGSTSWFRIQGEESEAMDYTRNQALLLEEWIPRYFAVPRTFEPPIRCYLDKPKARGKPFEILVTGKREVTLRFASEALNEPGILALALVQSFLVRRQLWAGENSQFHQIPDGLFVAMAAAFVEFQQPNSFRLGTATPRPPGTDFLELDLPEIPGKSVFVHGYYQWEFWKTMAGSASAFRELLREQLHGSTSLRLWMEEAGYPVPEPAAQELLWQTWLAARIEREAGLVRSVGVSRGQFFDLQQVIVRTGDDRIRVSLADLWETRHQAWLESERDRRLIQLKRVLPRVNPVYFNAFHSLGKVLESLEGGNRARFDEAVDQLAVDLEAAEHHHQLLKARGF